MKNVDRYTIAWKRSIPDCRSFSLPLFCPTMNCLKFASGTLRQRRVQVFAVRASQCSRGYNVRERTYSFDLGDSDLFSRYFVHDDDYVGVSAFVNEPALKSQRNALMLAVGALVPLSYGRLGKSWKHAAGLKALAE